MTPAEFDRRMSEFFDNPRLPVPLDPTAYYATARLIDLRPRARRRRFWRGLGRVLAAAGAAFGVWRV